jgi:hypothetical protein
MSRSLRTILVLLLAATLATTAVLADPLRGAQPRRSAVAVSDPMDLAARLWSWLARVWGKNGSQADPDGVTTKNGHQVDPSGNGSQSPAPVTANGDNGYQIDPNG